MDTLVSESTRQTHAPLDWFDVVSYVLRALPGDIEVDEAPNCAQLGHFASGIRVSLHHDDLLISSTRVRDLDGAALAAEQLRDVALACELATGRTARAVRFDGGSMVSEHGFALSGDLHAEHVLVHPVSRLTHFDSHIRR